MTYLVLKSTFAGGVRLNAGDIVELSAGEATPLLASGRLTEVAQSPKAEVQDRSVGLDASDAPAPKKRARKAKDAD